MDNRYGEGDRSASLGAMDAPDTPERAGRRPGRRSVRRPDPEEDRAIAQFLSDYRTVTGLGVEAVAGLPTGPGAVLPLVRTIRLFVRGGRSRRR